MNQINFSYNWNNKLSCHAHTTIRLRNDAKYIVGERYEETLNGKKLQEVTIESIRHFMLPKMSEFMAWIDTGYNQQEAESVIRKMYPQADWSRQQLSYILLVADKNTIAPSNEKIKLFIDKYLEHVGSKYKITAAETGKIKEINISIELLDYYFRSTDFKLKEKSVNNLVKYFNYVNQLMSQPELVIDQQFPNAWSAQFAKTLTGQQLGEYFKHLNKMGLAVKKDATGNVIDFVKPL